MQLIDLWLSTYRRAKTTKLHPVKFMVNTHYVATKTKF